MPKNRQQRNKEFEEFLSSAEEKFKTFKDGDVRAKYFESIIFSLVSAHLAPDGVLMSLHGSHFEVVAGTLLSVFDHLRTYRLYTLASNAPFARNLDRLARLRAPFNESELENIETRHLEYRGDEEFVRKASFGTPINRDWKPVAEYYLGPLMRERWRRLFSEGS